MKEVKIFSLIFIPLVGQCVVILEEVGGTRLVPIWIGVSEGNAIATRLQKKSFLRPMTHDLLANLIESTQMKVERITISDLRENTYYATIELKMGERQYKIDSRPSDSLALAVRTNAPIMIEDKVLDNCPLLRKPITESEVVQFKKILEHTKPEDFFRE